MAQKPNSAMIWRPNQLQYQGLRTTNAASFFPASAIECAGNFKLVLWLANIICVGHASLSQQLVVCDTSNTQYNIRIKYLFVCFSLS